MPRRSETRTDRPNRSGSRVDLRDEGGDPWIGDDPPGGLRSAQLLRTIAGVLGVAPDVFLSPGRGAGIDVGGADGAGAAERSYAAGASRLLRLYRDLPDQRRREQALRLIEALFEGDPEGDPEGDGT